MHDLICRLLPMLWLALGLCAHAPDCGAQPASAGAAARPARTALFLVAGSYGAPAIDRYVASLMQGLKDNGLHSRDIHVQYLDLARSDATRRRLLGAWIEDRYADHDFDLVFTVQQPALNFLLAEAGKLAPRATVYALTATPPLGGDTRGRRIVLPQTTMAYAATLQLALRLLPDTERVVVVMGSSEQELARQQLLRVELAPWKGKLLIEDTASLSVEQAAAKLAQLPPRTIVLGGGIQRDAGGQVFVGADSFARLIEATNAPTFVFFDSFVGAGAVGGVVSVLGELAKQIATLAAGQLQQPERPAGPVSFIANTTRPMFDWHALQRWGLDPALLPPDTVFVNRPPTLWAEHKAVVMVGTLSILLLSGFVVGLVLQNRRRSVAEQRFRVLVDHAPEAILVFDFDLARYVDCNPVAERLFGCSRDELLQGGPERFYGPAQPDGLPPADSVQQNGLLTLDGQNVAIERHIHTADGRDLVCEVQLVRLPSTEHRLIRASFSDVTERRRSEARIEQLAFYDALTGQPNRRLFQERLQRAIAACARARRHAALLYLDLDNFKTLNDSLGHDVGDLLLQEVARRLNHCVRQIDTVARLGGDEFVVMLEELSADEREAGKQAMLVGEKILAALEVPQQLAGKAHRSTASIGLTVFGASHGSADELIKRADLAMYQAKAEGRNSLRFFNPDMQAAVMARVELEADLRLALQEQRLLMVLQPQVDAEGRVTGAEALLRWPHDKRGMVSPLEFIPLAEETGLILTIGEWMLEAACRQLVAWAQDPARADLTLAVNVSVGQFRQVDFVERALAVIRRSGANPKRLKLELTESLLVVDVESTVGKMASLKVHGIGFALDDFGTGYSSLAYLKRLPLDQLKIDRSFVRDVLSDANDAAIARTVIALADSMGLAVIAEGVETEGQRDFLARHGCRAFQGNLFGRPMSPADFEQFVPRRAA